MNGGNGTVFLTKMAINPLKFCHFSLKRNTLAKQPGLNKLQSLMEIYLYKIQSKTMKSKSDFSTTKTLKMRSKYLVTVILKIIYLAITAAKSKVVRLKIFPSKKKNIC